MAKKTFNATWLGDGSPEAQVIYMGDMKFVKGDAVAVPADHDLADTIRQNPLFATEPEDDNTVPPPTDEEVEAMKATLDNRGVKYRANISGEKLRDLVADTEPAPNE
jgi:hypothetical protein